MMWARIENDRVIELTDLDPEGRFPPGVYNWQDCPDETAVYWVAEEGVDGVWIFYPYIEPPLPLPVVQDTKRHEMREACSNEITRSSYQSDALGAVHNYDCRLVDQVNLKVRYDIALSTTTSEPLWASDGTRYQWKLHTSSEIMDVMIDMNEHIKAAQVKLAAKLAAVDAATENSQVEAIHW